MSKKANARKSRGGSLSQYGLFDIPASLDVAVENDDGDADNDSDFEAELQALANAGSVKPKRPPRRQPQPNVDLDAMVSESMKDIPSDEELSGDEDDPELLGELNELTEDGGTLEGPSEVPSTQEIPTNVQKLLEERLKMYETAESNAKAAGETSRARRFGRGIKTLKDLHKQTKAGKAINNDDIPPEVSTSIKNPDPAVAAPTRAAPAIPAPTDENSENKLEQQPSENPVVADPELLQLLNARKNEYKISALTAKKSGDKDTALAYLKITKQFEGVIKAVEDGQPVDVSNMPGPPPPVHVAPKEENQLQTQSCNEEEVAEVEESLVEAGSVAEALQQRLQVYQQQEQTAKEQGNSSKARRMGRIVKQYEQAIKLCNAGKPVPFDDLPTPPGYAPIPVPKAEPEPQKAPPEPVDVPSEPTSPPNTSPASNSNSIRISGNHVPNSRSEKQLVLLLTKQKELKLAALAAKQNGELTQAKEYLRNAKRIDPLIDAAMGGLPVDMNSLPISPSAKMQLDAEYDVVMAEECTEDETGDLDVLTRLEAQLTKQLKMCLSTRDHHKAMGDVAGTNRFERLALSVTKDLDFVRLVHRTGGSIPKFHYEIKDFSIVKSFTDLGDNDLELTILRGINYNCSNPTEIDTYVKYEFPFPQEDPVRDKTTTAKDTNNPEYNATFTIPIQRTVRTCLRVFKRHGIKFEVYTKGGFFRSDVLLGTVSVKLQALETQCELHDSFDIMDGRKKVGGKLEVRLRLRHPMLTRQVEKLEEKWLIIDH